MSDLFRTQRRTLVYLLVANLLLYFGFQVWQAMFNNFAVEEIGVTPGSMGWIQALRELPGLIGFVLGVLALFLSEMRIMALSVILLGAGTLLAGQSQNVPFLLVSTFVMSIGFHFFYPSSSAVVLMVVDKKQAPKVLGQLQSVGAVVAVVATVVVYLLVDGLGYRSLFTWVGGLVVLGGLLLLPMDATKDGLPPRRRIIMRRQYWLYYTMSFLMGSRRHIFSTFAVFLLVQRHGISVQTTAILFLVNSLINAYALQAVGKWVSRLGERLMLTFAFGLLIFVFLGYAYVNSLPVLFVLFVLDNVLFGFNLALPTYFQKIAVDADEITSNLSTEQTINHIAAIIVPVIGGAIWEKFGYQAPFLAGVVIVAASLILTQFIRTPEESVTVPAAAVE